MGAVLGPLGRLICLALMFSSAAVAGSLLLSQTSDFALLLAGLILAVSSFGGLLAVILSPDCGDIRRTKRGGQLRRPLLRLRIGGVPSPKWFNAHFEPTALSLFVTVAAAAAAVAAVMLLVKGRRAQVRGASWVILKACLNKSVPVVKTPDTQPSGNSLFFLRNSVSLSSLRQCLRALGYRASGDFHETGSRCQGEKWRTTGFGHRLPFRSVKAARSAAGFSLDGGTNRMVTGGASWRSASQPGFVRFSSSSIWLPSALG